MTFTANICSNTLISSKIAFNYKNETYLISTSYVIDYPNKIINELNKLGISIINIYPECNWYRIKQVWNIGVNTGNIYIQGPNYNILKIQNIIDLLEKNYPITETLVGISLGLIFPLICLGLLFLYYKRKYTKQITNILKSHTENLTKKEIDNKIKDYILNPPSYELVYSIKLFKQNLYNQYNTNYYTYSKR